MPEENQRISLKRMREVLNEESTAGLMNKSWEEFLKKSMGEAWEKSLEYSHKNSP